MQATLNVRMDSIAKERGDRVLKKHGISTSEAVRSLWSYLAKEKKLPSFMEDDTRADVEKERKMAAAKRLVNISKKLDGSEYAKMSDKEIRDVIASKYLLPGEEIGGAE